MFILFSLADRKPHRNVTLMRLREVEGQKEQKGEGGESLACTNNT